MASTKALRQTKLKLAHCDCGKINNIPNTVKIIKLMGGKGIHVSQNVFISDELGRQILLNSTPTCLGERRFHQVRTEKTRNCDAANIYGDKYLKEKQELRVNYLNVIVFPTRQTEESFQSIS